MGRELEVTCGFSFLCEFPHGLTSVCSLVKSLLSEVWLRLPSITSLLPNILFPLETALFTLQERAVARHSFIKLVLNTFSWRQITTTNSLLPTINYQVSGIRYQLSTTKAQNEEDRNPQILKRSKQSGNERHCLFCRSKTLISSFVWLHKTPLDTGFRQVLQHSNQSGNERHCLFFSRVKDK